MLKYFQIWLRFREIEGIFECSTVYRSLCVLVKQEKIWGVVKPCELLPLIITMDITLSLEKETGEVKDHSKADQSEAECPVEASCRGQARPADRGHSLLSLLTRLLILGQVLWG